MSILNGVARFRLELIDHNDLHKPAFESQVGKIGHGPPAFDNNILCVFASLYKFHYSLTVPLSHMSILNGEARFRLELIDHNGLHKLTFESQVGKIGHRPPLPIPTYCVRLHPCTSFTAA